MAAQNFQLTTNSEVSLLLVIQKCCGQMYIHELKLSSDDDGPTVIQKLRQRYRELSRKAPYTMWDRYPVFWTAVIQTAILSTNISSDLEAQLHTRQVFVAQRKTDPELTAAYYQPTILPSGQPFTALSELLTSGLHQPQAKKHVLLIGLKPNWVAICVLVLLNVFICLGPGLLVGFLTHRVDLGVAVTSAIAAIVACLEALIVMYYK